MKALRIAPLRVPIHSTTRRTFITPPFATAPTQKLTASRTLPYPSSAIYSIIADINSYSNFLPYCEKSSVTQWSSPDKDGKKWPSEAELVIGFKGFSEAFKSKIYCVPGSVVEAVGGDTKTTLPKADIEHHGEEKSLPKQDSAILTNLLTRWSVRPFPYKPPAGAPGSKEAQDHTEVNLAIEYQFSNPIYSAMSGAVADKVAGVMIEAFEERVRKVLEGGIDGTREKAEDGVYS